MQCLDFVSDILIVLHKASNVGNFDSGSAISDRALYIVDLVADPRRVEFRHLQVYLTDFFMGTNQKPFPWILYTGKLQLHFTQGSCNYMYSCQPNSRLSCLQSSLHDCLICDFLHWCFTYFFHMTFWATTFHCNAAKRALCEKISKTLFSHDFLSKHFF